MDLSKHPVKSTVQLWGLAQFKGRTSDAPGAVGQALVWQGNGCSTAIVGVDSNSHRILTKSGSVYQLGTPNLGYVVAHPHILKELGF